MAAGAVQGADFTQHIRRQTYMDVLLFTVMGQCHNMTLIILICQSHDNLDTFWDFDRVQWQKSIRRGLTKSCTLELGEIGENHDTYTSNASFVLFNSQKIS